MWFPRFLFVVVGVFVCKYRTPNIGQVQLDLHGQVVSHLCPHIYPRFSFYIFVSNRRVSFPKRVSLGQLSLVLLSGDVAVNPGPIRFGFANCRSIRNKGPLLQDEVNSGGFDVFGLTETHIKLHDSKRFLQELTPDGFSLFHIPRSNKSGGGVGFFIKNTFETKDIVGAPNFTSFEHHTISLFLHGRSLILGVLYRPPNFVQLFLKISCLTSVFCRCYPHPLLFVVTSIFMLILYLPWFLNSSL